ncbi:hypothetical protein F2P45_32085 [Massilia sp. CCM 8733]|uniref:Integron gene cassette protein n=1 Tax=Massilia mucilaginosa TaxID=2609282 RepID=A0ABX0P2R7_9BURK|nr:hypothetical protein [Massilia mucilaginosa]NHZ93606.1 hypothetical protein [Massilia mucilaginosa]
MPTKSSGVLERTLKIVGLIVAVLILAFGMLRLWWYWPVSVEAKNIIKVIDKDIPQDMVSSCAAFAMTPDQFRAYWKDARPILASEFHAYYFGACHLKATENDREYLVGIGDAGIVNKGETSYYYVKKGAKSDFEDMK